MTNYYVDMFSEGNQLKEIHDARIRIVSSLDVGKIVGVNADGELDLIDPPQTVTANPTVEDYAPKLNTIKIGDTGYKIGGVEVFGNSQTHILNGISQDGITYYCDTSLRSPLGMNDMAFKYNRSVETAFVASANNVLEMLGLPEKITSIEDYAHFWNEEHQYLDVTYPAWHESQMAFLIIALFLFILTEPIIGGEVAYNGYIADVVRFKYVIDQQTPTNSYFIKFTPTIREDNGNYYIDYVGRKYTFADTQEIQTWAFFYN